MIRKLDGFDLETRTMIVVLMAFAFVALLSSAAFAITAPANTTLAYDLFDVCVNKMLKGPIGFIGGIFTIVMGAVMLAKQNFMAAIPCILGGAGVIKADTIVTSLGIIC